MSRKPRILTYDQRSSKQDGDVVLAEHGGVISESCYGHFGNASVVLTRHTNLVDDPLDWYSDLIADHRNRNWLITITLDPYRQYTRKLLPWANPAWQEIKLCYASPQSVYYGVAFGPYDGCRHSHDGRSAILFQLGEITKDDEKQLNDAFASYMVPLCQLYVQITDRDASFFDQALQARGLTLFKTYKFSRTETVYLYNGQYSLVKEIYDGLGAISVRGAMTPVDRVYDEVHISYRERAPLESRLKQLVWRAGSEMRWPFNYYALVDMIIPLLTGTGLPPYVLLEVIDWLPRMDLWSHVKKIHLIERVRNSIRDVMEARELRATKARPTSLQ